MCPEIMPVAGLEFRTVEKESKRMFNIGTHVGNLAGILRGRSNDVFGMGENQAFDATLQRFCENGSGFRDVNMAACKNHVVSSNYVKDIEKFRKHFAVGIEKR